MKLSIRLTRRIPGTTGRQGLSNQDTNGQPMVYNAETFPQALERAKATDIVAATVVENDPTTHPARVREYAEKLQAKLSFHGEITPLTTWQRAVAFSIGKNERISSSETEWDAVLG